MGPRACSAIGPDPPERDVARPQHDDGRPSQVASAAAVAPIVEPREARALESVPEDAGRARLEGRSATG